MRRIVLVLTLAFGLLTGPPPAATQAAGKVWRIGRLSVPSATMGASELDALREGLRKLGYVEGRNITIEARWANDDPAQLLRLARGLVGLKVDVICAAGTPAAIAAKQATPTTPIVFGRVAFPERTGLVASLARPGGNVTGVAFIGPEYGKRLELLREVAPKLVSVTLLYNDKNLASVMAMEETRQWATSMHVALDAIGIHDQPSLEAALAVMRGRRPGALMTTADAVLASYRARIVAFATEHRLVSMYGDRAYVDVGGLMFYGTSTRDMWHQAAIFVDRISRGAKPVELPVEQPTQFALVINLRTAKAIGLTIPPSVLVRADEAIQ